MISRTMRAALQALLDGRSCDVGDRPKNVTLRTMLALRNRGLIRRDTDADKWIVTDLGKSVADF